MLAYFLVYLAGLISGLFLALYLAIKAVEDYKSGDLAGEEGE